MSVVAESVVVVVVGPPLARQTSSLRHLTPQRQGPISAGKSTFCLRNLFANETFLDSSRKPKLLCTIIRFLKGSYKNVTVHKSYFFAKFRKVHSSKKAGFCGFQNFQIIHNFPQKDCLITQKLSSLHCLQS